MKGRETQGADNTPATITKWNLKTSVFRFLLLAGLPLYLQTPSFSTPFLSAVAHLPFPLFFLFPHLSFTCPHISHDSWFTHSTLNTDSHTAGVPPLLHSHPQPLHPLTPSPAGWLFFFFFPFKYLDRSHCVFFPVHSRTVSMPSLLLFPFLFMKSLKRGENKLGIRYGPEMNSVAFGMFCLCPPHLQVIVTVWKQPTGSGNAMLFLSKLFKFWVHTTFFSFYIIFFFFPPLPLNLRVEVSPEGKS